MYLPYVGVGFLKSCSCSLRSFPLLATSSRSICSTSNGCCLLPRSPDLISLIIMSCYPNHLASYAGSGRPINYVDDGHNNDYRRLNVNANNDDDQRYCNNDDDHYHNRSISSRRSSEDYYDRSSSEDYYDRHSSSDNYHHRRRSSFSDNSMQLSTSNNDDGQLLPGGRYVQRHHLNLTSSGDFSYDYVEYETPWEEDCWGK